MSTRNSSATPRTTSTAMTAAASPIRINLLGRIGDAQARCAMRATCSRTTSGGHNHTKSFQGYKHEQEEIHLAQHRNNLQFQVGR